MRNPTHLLRLAFRPLPAFAALLAVMVATSTVRAGVILPADLACETVETAAGAMSSLTEAPAQPADVPAGDESLVAQPLSDRPLEGGSGTMGTTTSGTGGTSSAAAWFVAKASANSLDLSGGVLDLVNSTIPAPPTFDLLRPPRHG